jgi:hypothetical protein
MAASLRARQVTMGIRALRFSERALRCKPKGPLGYSQFAPFPYRSGASGNARKAASKLTPGSTRTNRWLQSINRPEEQARSARKIYP